MQKRFAMDMAAAIHRRTVAKPRQIRLARLHVSGGYQLGRVFDVRGAVCLNVATRFA
jgi:hypothetical protein